MKYQPPPLKYPDQWAPMSIEDDFLTTTKQTFLRPKGRP